MEQKVIKIGNSVGIVLPSAIVRNTGLVPGTTVVVNEDINSSVRIVKKGDKPHPSITPEFYEWLKSFNERYKDALTELAKK